MDNKRTGYEMFYYYYYYYFCCCCLLKNDQLFTSFQWLLDVITYTYYHSLVRIHAYGHMHVRTYRYTHRFTYHLAYWPRYRNKTFTFPYLCSDNLIYRQPNNSDIILNPYRFAQQIAVYLRTGCNTNLQSYPVMRH